MDEQHTSVAARGLAALIDGLWLRGSLSRHNEFDSELPFHCLRLCKNAIAICEQAFAGETK